MALLAMSERCASAVEETWIGAASGNWSSGSNWLDGTVPVSALDLTLRFAPTSGSTITSTNNISDFFVLNRLSFHNKGRESLTIAGDSLVLMGNAPAIEIQESGNVTIGMPLSLNSLSGTTTIVGAGSGDLTLPGFFDSGGGAQRLVIAGQAPSYRTQLITFPTFYGPSGGVILQSGNLVLFAGASNSLHPFTVNGGSIRFNGGGTFFRDVSLNGDLLITTANNSTIQGVISSATPGTGLTLRTNRTNPTLTLASASTYDGATRVDSGVTSFLPTFREAGILRITGAKGSVLNSSLIDVRANGTVQIDPVSTGAINRIGDSTPVQLRGGRLILSASAASVLQTETAGDLSVGGYSIVSVTPSSSAGASLTFNSLARIERGAVLFRGTNLGGTTGADTGNVLFNNAPSGLVGGGGSGVETSILPYAVGDSVADGLGTGLVTYNQATGVRLLDVATEYSTSLPPAGASQNVRVTSDVANPATATMNSLTLAGGSVTGNGSLRITSGALLATKAASIENAIDFGSTDGKIFAISDLMVSGQIQGSDGLTKSSEGTLSLTGGGNSFSGPLTINSGRIAFSTTEQLGADSSAIIFNGQNAGLNYKGTGTLSLSRDITVSSAIALVEASGGGMIQLSGNVTGQGGLRVTTSNGSLLTLSGNNTFAGPLWIHAADTVIESDAALGTGELILAGTIRLAAPWVTSREIKVLSGAIDTAGFDATWNGLLVASGSASAFPENSVFEKRGAGRFTIGTAWDFLGKVEIHDGTMVINGFDEATSYTVSAEGTLSGNGGTSGFAKISGTLAPGDGIGILGTGALSLLADSVFELELGSADLYDRVNVQGAVSLTEAAKLSLILRPGFDALQGTLFTIIQNDGTDAVVFNDGGHFVYQTNALDEGERFFAGGHEFQISYTGGDGNDVTLLIVPEPHFGLLVAVGMAGLLTNCRRRR